MRKLILLGVAAVLFFSCGDDYEIIAPESKKIETRSGGSFEIPVSGNPDWYIERVETDGTYLPDTNNSFMQLKGYGTVESLPGYISLERTEDNSFTIHLKENFRTEPRTITVTVNNNGKKDYVKIIQSSGESYRLVKYVFTEREECTKEFKSDYGCRTIKGANWTSEPVRQPTDHIFDNVAFESTFESDDYEAFGWVPSEVVEMFHNMIIDGKLYLSRYKIKYISGLTRELMCKDIENGSAIMLPPYTTFTLVGEITYRERVCDYVLTVENESSGRRFKVSGVWKELVPIITHVYSYE